MIQILTANDIPAPAPSDIAVQRAVFLTRIETAAKFTEYKARHRAN